MNFFRTTYTLCTKISALPLLTEVSLWRVALHTFLLLLICSILTASCSLMLESKKIDSVVEKVNQETGGLYIRGGQLHTKNNVPERHFICELHSMPVRLDYFGTEESIANADLNKWDATLGLTMTPQKLYRWNSDGKKYYATAILDSTLLSADGLDLDAAKALHSKSENKILSKKEFQTELKENFKSDKVDEGKEYACNLGLILKVTLWFMIWFYTINQIVLLTILSALFLPLIETLRMRSLPNRLSYKKLVGLTVYATFPAFIAASIFEIFASNILSFQTVFFIVFIIYHMLAFGKLILHLNPQLQNNSRPDDDIDDDF